VAKKRRNLSEAPAQPSPARWNANVAAALLGVGTFALYAFCFGNGLTNWDDPDYLVHSPIAQAGWRGVAMAFSMPYEGGYYPLTHSLYAVVHAIAGDSATAFHVLQALLFAVTVAWVPRALSAFEVPPMAGFAAALLWAVHPFRVESVVWVANLKDTLGAAFIIGAFALEASNRRWPALLCFAAALLSKSMFFPLALLFPVSAWLRGASVTDAVKRCVPHVVLAAAAAIGGAMIHLGMESNHGLRSPAEAVATALWTPWWYLGRDLFPAGSRAVYDFDWVALPSARFFAALVLWAVTIAALVRFRSRGAWVAAAAYVLALAPVSGLVPLVYPVADRYALFPSLALFAGLAVLAERFAGRRVVIGAAVLAVALAPLNVLRQREWADSITLWEANEAWAKPWAVHANLANAYGTAERWADAARELDAGLKLKPDRRDAVAQLFFFEGAKNGVPPDDLFRMREQMDRTHADASSLTTAAEWCVTHHAYDAARAAAEHVPQLESNGYALRLLSEIDRKQSRLPEAVAHARAAIEHGEPKARIELVYALADSAQFEPALEATNYSFDDPVAAALLRGAKGYTLIRMGRNEEGAAEAEAAMRVIRQGQ
jgi:hypothetical protein